MVEIEQIISSLDVARQNFTITVSHENNFEATANSLTMSAKKRIDKIEVIDEQHRNYTKDGAQINISDTKTNEQNSSQQFITVTDGESAFILVGQSIPFTQNCLILT